MKRLALGLVVTLTLVLGSSLLTWNTTGVSYDHFTWAAYAGPIIYTDTEDELPGGCSDGIDNDNDTFIDCADSDCNNNIACTSPAPAMSMTGLVALLALLTVVGMVSLMRRRYQHE